MVADLTRQMVRATDLTARYGGEEFVVLLPETPVTDAGVVAERLRKRIEDETMRGQNGIPAITVSFGVSDQLIAMGTESPEKVLSAFINTADQAMYASKKAGRNRVTAYASEKGSLLQ
jgi:diguanylate cyclase (GGDEF)-like protein